MRVFISTSFALLWCLYCSYAQTRTIVINEFLYDPLPSAGLPEVEYVEILNVGPDAIQADGWILNERSIPAEAPN